MAAPTIIATYHVNILDNDTPVDFVALVKDEKGEYHLNACAADGTLIHPGTAIENVRPISVDGDGVSDYILINATQVDTTLALHVREKNGQYPFDPEERDATYYGDLNSDGKTDAWSYQPTLRRQGMATRIYQITPTYVTAQGK